MPDMLVKLYELPDNSIRLAGLRADGIEIRRTLGPEIEKVCRWVKEHFSEGWSSECRVSSTRTPSDCFIAVRDGRILGFSCINSVAPDFFGPIGVDEAERKNGIGAALLLEALWALKHQGYGYAVIGWVGPAEFYNKVCGAQIIPGSEPGIYKGMLRTNS